MSESRRAVLGSIARALGRGPAGATERTQAAAAVAARPAPVLPPEALLVGNALLSAFVSAAERASATCEDVGGSQNLPEAVVRFLESAGLPKRLRIGSDPWLRALPWESSKGLEILAGPAARDDTATLTLAFRAVAETGTLVQMSGADNPTTLVSLPEAHIVALTRDRIVGVAEQVWKALRDARLNEMPRALHWITGPSRTADIEQTLLMGAHGPRRLHILISDPQ